MDGIGPDVEYETDISQWYLWPFILYVVLVSIVLVEFFGQQLEGPLADNFLFLLELSSVDSSWLELEELFELLLLPF